jgi:chromosome partitioning protein
MDKEIVFSGNGGPRPHVIVLGSEKGGTGKSTTAMHLAIALIKMGYSVGSIDFDARQATFSRYLANRAARADLTGSALDGPLHRQVGRKDGAVDPASQASDTAWAKKAFTELAHCDFIVVDTPGNATPLARLAHVNADTLITPINDSLIDLDIIAELDLVKKEALGPGIYTQIVWEQNNRRVAMGVTPIDWIVMRNRLTHIDSRNKREIAGLLTKLAKRIGFRLSPGFGERVVFRELFLEGLTLLDLDFDEPGNLRSSSRLAARRELGELIRTIGICLPQQSVDAPARG